VGELRDGNFSRKKKKKTQKKTQKIRFWSYKCILKTKKIGQEAKLSAKDNT
jgi:hypothetical protein